MNDKAYIIIGGTFDPVHTGHLLLAEKLYTTFKQPIIFVPAAPPNYKAPPQTAPQQRLEMLQLALKDKPYFKINSSETFNKSYIPTVSSLRKLRKTIGYTTPIYFLIGEDSLITLDSWDNWQELFDLTNFVVAMRPGYSLDKMSPMLRDEYKNRHILRLDKPTQPYGYIYTLDLEPIDISSTKIRTNIAENLPINNLVDPKVAEYIIENKLYLNKNF
jgi:nicotinate-nucleotide adenylyltransferase